LQGISTKKEKGVIVTVSNELNGGKLVSLPIVWIVALLLLTPVFELAYNGSLAIWPYMFEVIFGLAQLPGIATLLILAGLAVVNLNGKYPIRQHTASWLLIGAGLICAIFTVCGMLVYEVPQRAYNDAWLKIEAIQNIPNWNTIVGFGALCATIVMLLVLIWFMRLELQGRGSNSGSGGKG